MSEGIEGAFQKVSEQKSLRLPLWDQLTEQVVLKKGGEVGEIKDMAVVVMNEAELKNRLANGEQPSLLELWQVTGKEGRPTVFVYEDDAATIRAIKELARHRGQTAEELFEKSFCLIADTHPDITEGRILLRVNRESFRQVMVDVGLLRPGNWLLLTRNSEANYPAAVKFEEGNYVQALRRGPYVIPAVDYEVFVKEDAGTIAQEVVAAVDRRVDEAHERGGLVMEFFDADLAMENRQPESWERPGVGRNDHIKEMVKGADVVCIALSSDFNSERPDLPVEEALAIVETVLG